MNKELIMKSDVLDILFENRNKAYGAYPLRKFYDDRLMKATGTMLAVALAFSAFTFLPHKNKIGGVDDNYTTTLYSIPLVPEKKKEADKPKTTEKQVVQKTKLQQWTKPVIVDVKTIASVLPANLDSAAIGSKTIITQHTGGPSVITPVETNPGGITEPVKPVVDKTTPVYNAEFMPTFPGGNEALTKFLQRNLHNPKDLEDGEAISVKVKFVVGYDGKLQGFEVVQDGGDEFNKEVVRVLKKMPDWIPGRSNGENVSVYYVIPVKFIPAE